MSSVRSDIYHLYGVKFFYVYFFLLILRLCGALMKLLFIGEQRTERTSVPFASLWVNLQQS